MHRHALRALAACAATALVSGSPPPRRAVPPPDTLHWSPLGEPGCGGDITAVRVNPYNATQVYIAGDMLGVGVSLDGGATWLAPDADSFLSWEAADFAFDPALRRVYVATMSGPYVANYSAAGGPLSLLFPGCTDSKLDPNLVTWSRIKLCAPAPSEIITITPATPITIPNIVKNDLPFLASNVRNTSFMVPMKSI